MRLYTPVRQTVQFTGTRYPSYLILRDGRLETLVVEFGPPGSGARKWIPRQMLATYATALADAPHLPNFSDSLALATRWIAENEGPSLIPTSAAGFSVPRGRHDPASNLPVERPPSPSAPGRLPRGHSEIP